jgi:hypothetical protein
MSESDQGKRPIEVVSDEDWKEQVKAADAKLDAERQAGQQSASTGESPSGEGGTEKDPQLPPASFEMLVRMFSTQAIVALGLIPTPEGKVERQLPLARHFIDILAVLEEKCTGNLSPEEDRLLENTLHELRMAYIEVAQTQTGQTTEQAEGTE